MHCSEVSQHPITNHKDSLATGSSPQSVTYNRLDYVLMLCIVNKPYLWNSLAIQAHHDPPKWLVIMLNVKVDLLPHQLLALNAVISI